MFRDEVFYFPHNLDFRGRVYPIPPHLNHMGSDLCRALLTFSTGKPLGAVGYRWLQIHLSNLMGNDKVAFDDRVAFTQDHMEQVLDSADAPLDGKQWWLAADYPWQALATCKELANAVRSGDPEAYVCRMPVHMDGSCNGLQHYAALGRDAIGAEAVNLTPSDKPQDVYMSVCNRVLATIEEDLAAPEPPPEAGDEARQQWEFRRAAASFVHGHVDRKVVKQTVMTSVYGVTLIGAREQIKARLHEKFAESELPFEEVDAEVYRAANYLARTTLDSIGEMFHAADQIKSWLAECARLVAQNNQPMSWLTPMKLPVVQPYRRFDSLIVRTVLQDVLIADHDEQLPVSVARQRSAFPPNYVHSLDSTHMMMTAIDCARKGLTFTAVHDSYWTLPCDVDVMNASLREQFVQLYELPLLTDLRDSLTTRFPSVAFPEVPARGDLDLSLVKESKYFFA